MSKPHLTRIPRMSRNMSRHNGVSCDACGKGGFSGNRYKCLVCYDFDLCSDCYSSGETGTGRHTTSHPMQCILTKVDAELFFGGDSQGSEQVYSFTCPMCGQLGFSEPELREHVTKQHSDGVPQEVICPVCATHPSGDPNHLTDDLSTHLTVEHRALREMEHDPTVQSRVRRLIGRRRAGLDRYVYREGGQSQDNIDPITELLSQLSSSGGGSSSGRRLVSDVPPHIQQLLDQQERQALERRSPQRRPMYRKIITSGGGGLLSSDSSSLGGGLYHPPAPKSDTFDLSRSITIELDKDKKGASHSQEPDANQLLASSTQPQLSEEEQTVLHKRRVDKSRFVQELLLSTLAYSDSSSEGEDT